MASGQVRAAPYVSQVPAIRGQSACSIAAPLRVSATQGGRVQVSPPALIGCPMTVALSRWVENSVQRAAFRQFQQPVVEIKQISSYSCRGRNSKSTGKLSEHSFGNALDVAGFTLADGQQITVVKGWWRGSAREAFLREAFAGACRDFYTVLGPGSDRQHYNHFHVDLLVTNVTKGGKHYCRPQPTGSVRRRGGRRSGLDRIREANPVHGPTRIGVPAARIYVRSQLVGRKRPTVALEQLRIRTIEV